jgi:hypothetical protein
MGAVLSGVFLVIYFAGGKGDNFGAGPATPAQAADQKKNTAGEIAFSSDPVKNLDEVNARLKSMADDIARLRDENGKLKADLAKVKEELGNRPAVDPGAPAPNLDDLPEYANVPGGNSILAAFPNAKDDIKEILEQIHGENRDNQREKLIERARENIGKMLNKMAEKHNWDAATRDQVAGILRDRQDRIKQIFAGVNRENSTPEERKQAKQDANQLLKDTGDQISALVGEEAAKEMMKFLNPKNRNNLKPNRAGGVRAPRRDRGGGNKGWGGK